MPEDVYRQAVYHSDDLKLTVEYPTDMSKISDLTADEFQGQIEIFSRILFDILATKGKKDFRIIMNPETGLYEYFAPTR